MFNYFEDEVHSYQAFIRDNFSLLGNNYIIIQEQYTIKSGIIDILAYNKLDECLVIIELKNVKIDIQVLSQVMKYYYELKDKYIEDYIISNPPEIIIIAPEFAANFFIYNNMPVKLLQIDYDDKNNRIVYSRIFPHIEDFTEENIDKKIFLKKQKTVIINQEQQQFIDKIIKCVQQFYAKKLKIIYNNNCVNILSNKIIAKIVIPNKWFDNTLQLVIYKNFVKSFIQNDFLYDPVIHKVQMFKTMAKLTIIDIPSFIKKG